MSATSSSDESEGQDGLTEEQLERQKQQKEADRIAARNKYIPQTAVYLFPFCEPEADERIVLVHVR